MARLGDLFRRRRLEGDMAEEIRSHIDALAGANVAAGMAPAEARAAALKRFGAVARIEEECRDEREFEWFGLWAKDLRFALRSLVRARAFSIVVVATLALGIAVATAVFDLTAWILIFSQPYPSPEQLYQVGYSDGRSPFIPVRFGLHFRAYQEQTSVFSEFAAARRDVSNVLIAGAPVVSDIVSVSDDTFHTLGVRPFLGRGFRPEEFKEGNDQVAVISESFWRQRLGSDPDVLGRQILIDQHPFKVIGVLSASQMLPTYFDRGDVYHPLVFKADPANVFEPLLYIIGRLKPGVTTKQATAQLAAAKLPTIPQWAAAFFSEQKPALLGLTEATGTGTYWVMFVAAGLLYAIACLNVMNLMLARLLGRGRELSIRLALGSTWWRIARLLLFESLGLTFAAWAIVLLLAQWAFPPLFAFITANPGARYISCWDARTLGCMTVLSLLASLVVVAVPMMRLSRASLNSGIKDGGTSVGEGLAMGRIRSGLVVLQAALAVMLLTGTGLMMRTFQKLHHVDLGFEPEGKVKVQVVFPHGTKLEPEEQLQLFTRLQDRLRSLPGVKAVAYGTDALLTGGFYGTAQLKMANGTYIPTSGAFMSDGYQQASGMVLKTGRWLTAGSRRNEVMINETLAKARFGSQNPVGLGIQLQVSGDHSYEVVGVLRDVRETVRTSPGPCVYFPIFFYPPNASTLILRFEKDPDPGFVSLIRKTLYEFDPRFIAASVTSVDQSVDNSMAAERYALTILRALAAIALGLAVVGLFSIIAYTVDMRMREFGVRLALGAEPRDLHRLVMRRGLSTTLSGVGVGIVCALAMTRFMRSLLFDTTPYDPMVYTAVAVVLMAAAAAACWLPARRAARVDITKLLRDE